MSRKTKFFVQVGVASLLLTIIFSFGIQWIVGNHEIWYSFPAVWACLAAVMVMGAKDFPV